MQQGSGTSAPATGSGLYLQPGGQVLTDEQILGLEPASDTSAARDFEEPAGDMTGDGESILVSQPEAQRDSSGNTGPRNDGIGDAAAEPAWLKALEAQDRKSVV